jgi:glycosyltransferase involved in cell wall biosynthesis
MPQAFDYSPDANAWQQPLQLGRHFETVLAVPAGVSVPYDIRVACRVEPLSAQYGEPGWRRSFVQGSLALAGRLPPGKWVVAAGAAQLAVEVAYKIGREFRLPWLWLCWDHPFGARYRSKSPARWLERQARTIHLRRRLQDARAVALFYSADCLRPFRLPRTALRPLGNGVLFGRLRMIAARAKRQAGLVVMIGLVSKDKGADVLLDAFERVCHGRPGARLRLIGAIDRSYESLFVRRISTGHLQGRVEWLGDVSFDEAMAAAASGEVGVCPYRPREWLRCNQVLKIGEYQALGLVPVASDLPGVRCLVSDGVDGRLVPADSPLDLARAVGRLLDDPTLRRTLAAASIERARGRDWGLVGDRLAALVSEAALGKNRE